MNQIEDDLGEAFQRVPLRVCHVITGLNAGGAERMLTRIATGSARAGVQQIVISLMDEGEYGARLRDAGVELHCLGMQLISGFPIAFLRLIWILRKSRPDIVMTWLYHADLLGTMCAVLAGLNPRRVVWNLRCSDVEFARYPRSTRWSVWVLSRLSSLPGAVAVNSDSGQAFHVALGYRPRAWVYLPNGLDIDTWRADPTDRLRIRKELGVNADDILVGMVARVDPMKDHSMFLAAAEQVASRCSNVHFVMVGKGTLDIPIPEKIEQRVVGLGPRTDVSSVMRALDIHVLSSAFGEGFPNVVCEAMASEVPCVVTDVGDAAKLVGDTGLTVPPRDPVALAKAVLRLIEEPPERRRKRGRSARVIIEKNYNIEAVRRLYLKLWFEVAVRL